MVTSRLRLMPLTVAAAALGLAVLARADAPTWKALKPGLDHRALVVEGVGGSIKVGVEVLRVDLTKFDLRILEARTHGALGLTARELCEKTGAVAAVNGSFFAENYAPLGLLVSGGKTLNPARQADWGVFAVSHGKATLHHVKEFDAKPDVSFAVEAGPRLVLDGKPVVSLKPQVARRTAIAVDGSGRVLLVATEGPLFTSELAELLARPEADGGLGAVAALNLDGGSSTQMYVNLEGEHVDVVGIGGVANTVAVFPR